MESLSDILKKYPATDKGTLHSYDEVYDSLFAPYRDKPIRLLEIGVREGDSLRAWREYFTDSDAEIYGIDNGAQNGVIPSEDRFTVSYADSGKPDTLDWFVNEFGQMYDIIIDDGSHNPFHQAANFAVLWPYVRRGGIYICEDVEGIENAQKLQRAFGGEILDRREVKKRHDDILIVWRR